MSTIHGILRSRQTRKRGFTLIELVLVLALLLIVSQIASTSFVSVEKRELRRFCVQLQSDLRLAQRLSVIESRRYEVVFDVRDNSYRLRANLPSLGTYALVKTVRLENGVYIENINRATIAYTPTATTGDAGSIDLATETSHYTAKITINVGAGRVAIKEIVRR